MRRCNRLFFGLLASSALLSITAASAEVVRTTLYSFSDREGSPSTLAIDDSGALYGALRTGGPNTCVINGVNFGCGEVFRLAPPQEGETAWTELLLQGFSTDADGGRFPGAIGISNADVAGIDFNGVNQVFALTPPADNSTPWPASRLATITNQTEENLVPDGQGGFYGLSDRGGDFGLGQLFQVTPSASGWTFQTLFSFSPTITLGQPMGLARDNQSGAVYGEFLGRGSVFQLLPPAPGQTAWTEKVIHVFPAASLGWPLSVDQRGVVYGATANGSTNTNKVFKLTPPKKGKTTWTAATVTTFTKALGPTYGLIPSQVIVDSAGSVFGATLIGGSNHSCPSGCGTLFKLSPITGSNKYTVTILDDEGATSGDVFAGLTADKNGVLYGMTGTDQFTVSGGVAHYNRIATVFQVTGSGYQP